MNPCVGSTFLSLLLLLLISGSLGARGRFAQKLFKDLFTNYTSALRPVENTDYVINVTLQVTLSQIIDMDERNQILTTYLWVRQVWMDYYLTWTKEDYDDLDTIRIPSRYVWKPDIVLYNSADDQFSGSMETNVVLRSDGQVTWDQPAITKSSCSVDVAYFPFDLQQCLLTFGSWTHNGNQMDLINALETADLADLVPNVEWQVLGMPAKKNVILYGCCSDPYPDITFTLHLKRRASFYIFNLLIPCMMISFLAPLGFYLPADSGEKVSLGVTVLLALTVFQLLVAESMPPSESVPLIGKYYIATMTMVTASTALTIFIMNLHHCGPEARPVPGWVRTLVLSVLNRVCLVYEVGENCTRTEPEDTEEVNRKPVTNSWEVNRDAAEEEQKTTRQRDELSVTIESSGNELVSFQRAEKLTKKKTTIFKKESDPNVPEDTINAAGNEQEQNGGLRKAANSGFQNKETNKTNRESECGGKEMTAGDVAEVESEENGESGKFKTDENKTRSGFGAGEEENGGRRREMRPRSGVGDDSEEKSEQKSSGKRGKEEFTRTRDDSKDEKCRSKDERGNSEDNSEATVGFKKVLSFKAVDAQFRGQNKDCNALKEETRRKQSAFESEEESVKKSLTSEAGESSGNVRCLCCHCCLHGDRAEGGVGASLRGDVASIAASFQEQRAAQALMADWRKVAKVMDRSFMWMFFIMVFIMSLLILGKAV